MRKFNKDLSSLIVFREPKKILRLPECLTLNCLWFGSASLGVKRNCFETPSLPEKTNSHDLFLHSPNLLMMVIQFHLVIGSKRIFSAGAFPSKSWKIYSLDIFITVASHHGTSTVRSHALRCWIEMTYGPQNDAKQKPLPISKEGKMRSLFNLTAKICSFYPPDGLLNVASINKLKTTIETKKRNDCSRSVKGGKAATQSNTDLYVNSSKYGGIRVS